MDASIQDAQAQLFGEMDAKARQVIEGRFQVRLESSSSTQNHQRAWDVYQNTTIKLLKAIRSGVTIKDPAAYGASVARNSCRDFWRNETRAWSDLKGRLSRFLKHQPLWAVWEAPDQIGLICGPAQGRAKAHAAGDRGG